RTDNRRVEPTAGLDARRAAVIMLPGFDGHLVSSALLESQLLARGDTSDARTAALRAWRSARAFGPASSVRSIFDAGAAALGAARARAPPAHGEASDQGGGAAPQHEGGPRHRAPGAPGGLPRHSAPGATAGLPRHSAPGATAGLPRHSAPGATAGLPRHSA